MVRLTANDNFANSKEYDFNYFDITHEYVNAHNHDFYEFLIVVSGEGLHKVNGESYKISRGSFYFLEPNDSHAFRVEKNNIVRILNLAFCREITEEIMFLFNINPKSEAANRIESVKSEDFLPYNKTTYFDEEAKSTVKLGSFISASQIDEIINFYKIILEMERDIETLRPMIKMFFALLITKNEIIGFQNSKNNKSLPDWLKIAIEGLQKQENYSDGIKYLIDSTGKTQSYVCRIFQKHLNCSPSEYINSIRIRNSANLLKYTNNTVIGISMDCGFTSLSHFNHLFKKIYGKSPTKWRAGA